MKLQHLEATCIFQWSSLNLISLCWESFAQVIDEACTEILKSAVVLSQVEGFETDKDIIPTVRRSGIRARIHIAFIDKYP